MSIEGGIRHVETTIAANPRREGGLLGATMILDQPWETATFASLDGGRTWSTHRFEGVWGDPQVAFAKSGIALFAGLAEAESDESASSELRVFRSSDGGLTWQAPIGLGSGYDHPQLAVDPTGGRHSGRAYVGVMWDYPLYRLGVFRSDDDGLTWSGPVEFADGGGELGVNVCPLVVLGDGTLFVPYTDFEIDASRNGARPEVTFWSVISTDGGVTFSPSRRIATVRHAAYPPVRFQGFPMFTAAGADRRRIVAAWNVVTESGPRIVTSWSDDAGSSWSEPLPLPRVASGEQWQPALAWNGSVLGITWYENDAGPAKAPCTDASPCFHHYFSASRDGGLTFLPPVRVSSAPSHTPSGDDRYGQGGDYMGLAATGDGTFRTLWADSRSGTFQVYTAEVRVLPGGHGDRRRRFAGP